jgi:hypothetical protein
MKFGTPALRVSDEVVTRSSTYIFNIVTNNPVYDGVVVEITFPSDFEPNVTSVTGSVNMVRTPTFSLSGRVLTIRRGFNRYVDINSQYFISVSPVRNPMSKKTSQSISISVYTETGFLIDRTDTGLTVTTIAGSITVYSITAARYVVNSVEVYTIEIQPSESVVKDARIRIGVPPEMSVGSDCSVQLLSGFNAAAVPSVQVSGNNVVVSNAFPATVTSSRIKFAVSSLRNPRTAAKTSAFSLEICEDSACVNLIASDSSISITAVHDSLNSVSINISPKITGEIATYTFTIDTKNTIPAGGQILISFPTTVVILTSSFPTCTSLQGFFSAISCSYTSSSITITNGFSSDFGAGVLTLSVTQIKNPPTTQPTSTFKVYTSLNSSLIDTLESNILITIDTPNSLNEGSLTSDISIITGATQDYILSITPYNYMPSGGTVVLVAPSGYNFSNNIQCSAYGTATSSAACTLSTDLTISPTFPSAIVTSRFQIKLSNMINPISTEETGSFRIYTKDGIYFIDKKESGITIKATIPASFSSVLIHPTNSFISLTSDYSFQIYFSIPVPSIGYLLIKFPSTISRATDNGSILVNTCYKDNIEVVCEFTNNDTIKIYSINIPSPTASTIKVTNLQNQTTAGSTTPFIIYSMINGYSIQQSLDRTLTFSCKDPCATCANLPDNCTSCKTSSGFPYFYDSSCNSACKEGFTDVGNYTCTECSAICKTCLGTINTCTSCKQSGTYPFLYNGTCVSSCPDSYYLTSSLECIKCTGSCSTCSNSPTYCTSCLSNLLLYNNSCIASCPTGTTVQSGLNCLDCSTNCKNCKDSVDICTSCIDGMKLYLSKCIPACPADVTVDLGTSCADCTSNCKTCKGVSSFCVTCKDGFLLLNNSCVEACPGGYININGKCEMCNINCTQCLGDVNTCTACKSGRYLYNSSCLEKCPENITVITGIICENCSSICATCKTTPSFCTSCSASNYLYNNSCIDVCPSSTLALEGSCKFCADNCKTCKNSLSNCIECKDAYYLYNSLCVATCPPATALIGNSCQACAEGCSACSSAVNICTACGSGWFLYNSSCVRTCPSGFLQLNGACQKCNNSCKECEDNTSKCVECESGYYLHNNQCLEECPSLTIPIDTTCQACTSPCLGCKDLTTLCISCKPGYKLHQNTCISDCPSGYVNISGLCSPCTSPCITCSTTSEYCLSCTDNLIPFAGSCISECPSGYQLLSGKCIEENPKLPDCSNGCTQELLQNNNCDEPCNVPACAYDGGHCTVSFDCAVGCTLEKLMNIVCDEECNVKDCGFDAWKCATDQDCAVGCTGELLSNRVCDEVCNVAACEFDKGKCNEAPECEEGCSQDLLDNEECDEVCNVASCAYDKGKCYIAPECQEGCSQDLLDNEECDEVCNIESCNYDNGACERYCSPGCTSDLLANEICDLACNTLLCNYDNSTCTQVISKTSISYDEEIQIKQHPVPFTGTSVVFSATILIVKLNSGGIALASSLIPCWSMLHAGSSWGTLSILSQIDSTHGRELLEVDDEKILAAFVAMACLMLLHYMINIAFVVVYVYNVRRKDEGHKAWSTRCRRAHICNLIVCTLCSFQCIRLTYSGLLNRESFKTYYEKWSNIYKPLSLMSYISLITVLVPMVIILSYILLEFSTGNEVWVIALDNLILTILSSTLIIMDQVSMAKAIAKEDQRMELESSMNMKGLNDETVFDVERRWVVSEQFGDEIVGNNDNRDSLLCSGKIEVAHIENTFQEPEAECGDAKNDKQIKSTQEMNEDATILTLKSRDNIDACTEIDADMQLADTRKGFQINKLHSNEVELQTPRKHLHLDKLDSYEIILEPTPKTPKFDKEVLFNSLVKDFKIDKVENYEIPATVKKFFIDKPSDSTIYLEDTKFTPTRSYGFYKTQSFHIHDKKSPKFEVDKLNESGFFFTPVKQYSVETNAIYDISPIPLKLESDKDSISEPNYDLLLTEIQQESEIELNTAEVDEDDPNKIKVKHVSTNNLVLVEHDSKEVQVLDDEGNRLENHDYNLSEFEVETVNKDNVKFATLRRMKRPYDRISVIREFKGARIVDLEMKGEGGWLIGKTVRSEEDFDFSNAIVDSRNKDIVIVPHIKTGKLAKIQKAFTLSESQIMKDVEIDPEDVHLGRVYRGNEEDVYVRSFVGARIIGLLPNILPYINPPSFILSPRAKTSQEHLIRIATDESLEIQEDEGQLDFESSSSDMSFYDYEPEPYPYEISPEDGNQYFSVSRQKHRKPRKRTKKARRKEMRSIYLQRLDVPRVALEKQRVRASTRLGQPRSIYFEGSVDDFIKTALPRIPY